MPPGAQPSEPEPALSEGRASDRVERVAKRAASTTTALRAEGIGGKAAEKILSVDTLARFIPNEPPPENNCHPETSAGRKQLSSRAKRRAESFLRCTMPPGAQPSGPEPALSEGRASDRVERVAKRAASTTTALRAEGIGGKAAEKILSVDALARQLNSRGQPIRFPGARYVRWIRASFGRTVQGRNWDGLQPLRDSGAVKRRNGENHALHAVEMPAPQKPRASAAGPQPPPEP